MFTIGCHDRCAATGHFLGSVFPFSVRDICITLDEALSSSIPLFSGRPICQHKLTHGSSALKAPAVSSPGQRAGVSGGFSNSLFPQFLRKGLGVRISSSRYLRDTTYPVTPVLCHGSHLYDSAQPRNVTGGRAQVAG